MMNLMMPQRSLGERMFGDVLGGLKKAVSGEPVVEKVVVEQGPLSADRAISEIDARAAKGEITYQVSACHAMPPPPHHLPAR
jgi:hypothetical protein